MNELHEHLCRRLAAGHRQLRRSLDGLPPGAAELGADPGWRRYRYGLGLDGSIQGIVRHVAAWKHAAAAGLSSGEFPDAGSLEVPTGWDALLEWLDAGQQSLATGLAGTAPGGLARMLLWEGQELTVASVVTHLIEHDHYHAGQVNLLRQQRGELLADR